MDWLDEAFHTTNKKDAPYKFGIQLDYRVPITGNIICFVIVASGFIYIIKYITISFTDYHQTTSILSGYVETTYKAFPLGAIFVKTVS